MFEIRSLRFARNNNITAVGIGPSDHITMDITISVDPIIARRPPYLEINNTDWGAYKDSLSVEPIIDLDGDNITAISKEFTKLYNDIQTAKTAYTPMVNYVKKNTLKPTSKFKRLTTILD